jgi:hypothetical protein
MRCRSDDLQIGVALQRWRLLGVPLDLEVQLNLVVQFDLVVQLQSCLRFARES